MVHSAHLVVCKDDVINDIHSNGVTEFHLLYW